MTIDDLGDLSTIRVEPGPHSSLLVTLDRPDRLNAIVPTMMNEMLAVVGAVDLDPAIRSVVLTGAGRGFCAGLDMKGTDELPPGADGVGAVPARLMNQDHIATVNEAIHTSRKPWIAAVNGPCVGGGFAMALACDIRHAASSATFGAVFIKIGVSNCDMGTSYFLPRLIGASRSAELMLTGRIVDADEADRIGLVASVVDDESLLQKALESAALIEQNPPFGTWMTKETMWQTIDSPSLRHAMDMENRTQIMCTGTGEVDEARAAFVAKRAPVWAGL